MPKIYNLKSCTVADAENIIDIWYARAQKIAIQLNSNAYDGKKKEQAYAVILKLSKMVTYVSLKIIERRNIKLPRSKHVGWISSKH